MAGAAAIETDGVLNTECWPDDSAADVSRTSFNPVRLKAGDHDIKIEKAGFKAWQRTMTVASRSNATVEANLEKVQ